MEKTLAAARYQHTCWPEDMSPSRRQAYKFVNIVSDPKPK
jgi:hypothetical protein